MTTLRRLFAIALLLGCACTGLAASALEPIPVPIATRAAPAEPASAAAPNAAPVETPAPPAPPAIPAVRVSLQTSVGTMVIALEREKAPLTSANFLRYVREKRFDGMSFYRSVNIAPGYGMIQGGTSGNPKRNLPPIKHEPTTLTGLSHTNGAISMARGDPGTADGDFFIVIGELTALDANPTQSGDNLGYAVFGRVIEGMDTVQRILEAPISATKGEGAMKGQMLAAPIKIIRATRLP